MPYTPATQPENFLALYARAMRLYFATCPAVIFLSLLSVIVATLPWLFLLVHGYSSFFYWLSLISTTLVIILFTTILRVMNCFQNGVIETCGRSMIISLRQLPRMISASIIAIATLSIVGFLSIPATKMLLIQALTIWPDLSLSPDTRGLLVLFMPALVMFFLVVLWSLTAPLVVSEYEAVINSITRSARLVNGNWWQTFAVVFAPVIYSAIIMLTLAEQHFHLIDWTFIALTASGVFVSTWGLIFNLRTWDTRPFITRISPLHFCYWYFWENKHNYLPDIWATTVIAFITTLITIACYDLYVNIHESPIIFNELPTVIIIIELLLLVLFIPWHIATLVVQLYNLKFQEEQPP